MKFVENEIKEEKIIDVMIDVHYNSEVEEVLSMIVDMGCPLSLAG